MSIRVDTSSLITGAVVVGVPGLGVLAESVPSTGEHGAGYLYASLEFPADNGKEVRGLITTWPTLGTLTAFEDSSFEYDGPTDSFAFQMYVDGVATGTPQTVTITVGAVAYDLTTQDAAHAHAADNLTLSAGLTLVVDSAAHSHAADNLALTADTANTPWTPADITTKVWFDAADESTFTLTGENRVTQWRDKSGNDLHLAPPIEPPLRTAALLNGLPGVYFDAASLSKYMVTPAHASPTGAGGFTVAAVFKRRGEPVYYSNIFTKGSINNEWSVILCDDEAGMPTSVRNSIIFRGGNTATTNQAASPPNTLVTGVDYLFSGQASNDFMKQYLYGTELAGSASAQVRSFGTGSSALNVGGPGGNRTEGNVYELVVLYDDVTTDNRQKLEGYLAHKWGLAGDLPSDHPYKSAAPGGAGGAVSITAESAGHSHTADSAVLAAALTLGVQSASHAHTADAATLAASLTLAVQDALHAHLVDNLTLTADTASSHTLSVAAATHAHLAGALALTASHTLSVADATHGHTVETLALSAALNLLVDSALHTQLADNATLTDSFSSNLTIADTQHSHLADALTLSGALALIVHDAQHGHLSGQALLSAAHSLFVQNAAHVHLADAVDASTGLAVSIASAFHAHTADNADADTALSLAIHDALHAHQAEAATLTAALTLIVSDAIHEHFADQVEFFIPEPLVDQLRRSVFLRIAKQQATLRVQQGAATVTVPSSGVFLKVR